MDPTLLVPIPDAIQVPWGWFQGLLSLTFVVHILLVNIALGGALVALATTWCRHECTEPVGRDISVKLPTVIALAVNFGVAPLLFLQTLYGHMFYVSDILMGWWWLAVPFLIIVAYYAAYLYDFKFDGLGSLRGLVIGCCALVLLLVGFLFANNISLLGNPVQWPRYFTAEGGTFLNFGEPTLIPRYLHFVMASLAVGGLAAALNWSRASKQAEPLADWYVDQGMKWFFRGTLAQLIVGPWFLLGFEREVILQFMGHSGLATALFLAALMGVLMCLHAGFFKQPGRGAFYLVCTVAAMTGVREFARIGTMNPYFKASTIEVTGQYSPMIMFGVALVVGLGLMAYILKLAAKARKEG
ncbi:MAG: hypothetical protein KKE73_13590 [Proteobacteria bacterium]|nr:hypothetical protein [Pseudomonadota bacterium]